MAGINTIGRLAVSMDLNSAKFSQKLRTVQKDVGKAETRMQKFSKAIGGLRTIAAAGGLASIVAGVQSIQQELQTATNFALDFNNAFTNDAVRANLIDYGEQMEALNRRQMQAGANMASNFAQFSYNIERMKTQIAELFSDGNENAVVTDADLEQARKNIVEKIGGGFEEAAGRASNFMLSGSFAGGADQLQKEAQRLANERADTNKRLYEEMMQTELQLTNLGLQRQFMSREEYTKKRIELTKRLAEIQANLDPDGLMEGTRWQERLDQLNLISEQQESWVKEQDEKDKQTKADREQREQEHQDKLAAIRAASIEKQRARERMIAEESAQQEIARMQQQFMSEEEQRELQFTTQMDQLNNYLDQDLITREQYNNLRTQLRDQWIQADLAANNSWQTQTLDSMVGLADAAFGNSKASALRQAMLSMQVNLAKASEVGFPQNIPMIAAATTQGFGIYNTIKGIAHSGLDRVPSEGTYLLDKDEMVLNKQDAQAVRSGDGLGGGQSITINPTINSQGRDSESENQLLDRMTMRIVNDFKSNGPIARTARAYS